jgi:hypothetical protein
MLSEFNISWLADAPGKQKKTSNNKQSLLVALINSGGQYILPS